MTFDIILFTIIALVLFWRLRIILGDESYNHRQHNDRFWNLHKNKDRAQTVKNTTLDTEAISTPDNWDSICNIDNDFDKETFLKNAQRAFIEIMKAFSNEDKKMLKNLLDPRIYNEFSKAIDDRHKKGLNRDMIVVAVQKPEVKKIAVHGSSAEVTVTFMSEQIDVTRDQNGKIITGDPDQIIKVIDTWTFSRDLKSTDPKWALSATWAE